MCESKQAVVVRDREGMRRLEAADDWTALTLVASLSADPRDYDELRRAWLRYEPDSPLEDLPWVTASAEPESGPWLLLDLACSRLVAGRGAELPEDQMAYQRDEGEWAPGNPVVWINLPPQWTALDASSWREAVPELPLIREPLDARGVLFGQPLADAIARRTLNMAARERLPREPPLRTDVNRGKLSEAEKRTAAHWHDLTIRVHAGWLMNPRRDLDGKAPRVFLHEGREWVSREIHGRQMQWTDRGVAPRPLDRDTFAYRFGPLGTHEVVMYFDLCRELIQSAWEWIAKTPKIDRVRLFRLLRKRGASWLNSSSLDGEPNSPATIIENERRRIPLVGDGHLDCDCPLCRLEGNQATGPTFRGFDGHHLELDQEFAFSLCKTRSEWEEQEAEYEQTLEVQGPIPTDDELDSSIDPSDEFASVWSRSYVNAELLQSEDPMSPMPVFAIAMRLSELVCDLKTIAGTANQISALNNAFDQYRENGPLKRRRSATTLRKILEKIAASHPKLTPKVADLQSLVDDQLRRLLDQY